jgi:hypothetical protein
MQQRRDGKNIYATNNDRSMRVIATQVKCSGDRACNDRINYSDASEPLSEWWLASVFMHGLWNSGVVSS